MKIYGRIKQQMESVVDEEGIQNLKEFQYSCDPGGYVV